jgi:Domain of unknown function (DUF4159)
MLSFGFAMTPERRTRPFRVAIGVVVVLAGLSATAAAQRGFRRYRERELQIHNVPYNGQFTFVRVNYTTAPGGYWYQGLPAWSHGYPIAEQNLMRILNEISDLGPRTEEINSLKFDDPEIFKYPVAYIIEVGWWEMTDSEAAGLRAYIQKGGFLIVDDFKVAGFGGGFAGMGGGGWDTFEQNIKRALPEVRFFEMSARDPIFHAFFEIGRLDVIPQAYNAGQPVFRGVYEDNDPSKRLQMIINYNTDVSQFWEWSGRGLRPIDDTNEAYKLGVNYIIYGMTH